MFATLGMKLLGGSTAFLAIALGICWLGWTRAADRRDELELELGQANAKIELLELDAQLKEAAAIERAIDESNATDEARRLEDARSEPGDDQFTRRARRMCERVRQLGGRLDDYPACGRFEGAGGA